MEKQSVFIAIDLKSFYASVECRERGRDPLTTNLVVADKSRTEKTICLAVSPSLKSFGIPGRARLFEVVQKVREVNARRRYYAPGHQFAGKSDDITKLNANPSLELDYIVAPPQMALYIDYSARIYNVYLKYIAPEDIHTYSIDEVFIDATHYLSTYHMTAHELAMTMIRDVLKETGITATAGIGTNLYLCKIAMDIVAKHIEPDADGVRIAELDELSYRKHPEAFLREYEGYIHTDAYSGYNAVSGVKRCLCYTHLRRAFVDALPKDIHNSEASKPAEAILRLNQLFNIESELEALPPDQKKKERLIREKPLLEAFWSWAEKSAIGELPKSKLSKAFHYALNNREGFWNYLEDGNCSISNSLAENCIRPFVIGRKNWLFSGSPKGAEASAGIYTLVETAKANGFAPMKYIKYILSDMPGSAFLEHPEYLDDYLPWNPLVKEFCR